MFKKHSKKKGKTEQGEDDQNKKKEEPAAVKLVSTPATILSSRIYSNSQEKVKLTIFIEGKTLTYSAVDAEYLFKGNPKRSSSEGSEESILGIMREGTIEELENFFIRENVDPVSFINSKKIGKYKRSLSHIATLEKRADILQYFCKLGIKLNKYDSFGDTPLHYIAKEYDRKTALALFEFEGTARLLNKKNKYKMTPYDYADSRGQKEFVKIVGVVFINEMKRAINLIREGNAETLDLFCKSLSISDELKEPIKLVCEGNVESLKLFFKDKNIDSFVRSKKIQGELSLLHIATLAKCTNVVRFFRKSGVDLEHKDAWGQSPLHYIAKEYDRKTFFALRGFKNCITVLDEKNNYGLTPRSYAEFYEQKEFSEITEAYERAHFCNDFCEVYDNETMFIAWEVEKIKRKERKARGIEEEKEDNFLRKARIKTALP